MQIKKIYDKIKLLISIDEEAIETLVMQKLTKLPDGSFRCLDCEYVSRVKACVKIHIESKHVISGGFSCHECGKHVPTRNALKVHRQWNHQTVQMFPHNSLS